MGLLRLLLAGLVMISHLGISIGGLNPGVVSVVIFYLLAGHVVSHLWRRRPVQARWPASLWFYRDRLWRILPLYGFALLLATLLWWAGAQSAFIAKPPQLSDWLANLSIIPLNYYMFTGQDAFTLLPPVWSLAAELQFYLMIPLLLGRPRWMLGIACASFAVFVCAQLGWLNTDVFGYRLLAGIAFIFLTGTLLGEPSARARNVLLGVWLASLFYSAYLLFYELHRPYNTEVVLGLSIGLPLLRLLLRYPLQGFWHAVQRQAGGLSYGVFLLHFPAIWLMQGAGLSGLALACGVAALSLLLAWLAHRFIETPLWKRHRRRLTSANTPNRANGFSGPATDQLRMG